MTQHARTIDEIQVQFVKGVGEARARELNKINIFTVRDLLEYTPRRYLDRRSISKISQIQEGDDTTVVGRVVKIKLIPRPRPRLVVTIYDKTGLLDGVWFNQARYFAKIFKDDQEVAFNGRVNFYRSWQIVHPEFDIIEESREQLDTGQIIPLYRSTQELKNIGLSSRGFRRIIHNALQKYKSAVPETLPPSLKNRYKLLTRRQAFQQIHFPESLQQIEQPLRRLKYEEMFHFQLLMALRRRHQRAPQKGLRMTTEGSIIRRVLSRLPFELTEAQRQVLKEIYHDLKSAQPMNRLLQGDVGSGKTLVAFITSIIAMENDYQVALMTPTEILAEQHYLNFKGYLSDLDFRHCLLTGSLKNRKKEVFYEGIRTGEYSLVVGTHALFQEAVEFKNLGLVVIDEQHRFGVLQRGQLIKKGWNPHILVMTATPIPRTLALTLYGDLDTSVIDQLPPGRRPILTLWRTEEKLSEIYQFIREKIESGQQAFTVYPLIEESEKIDLKAATESYRTLSKSIFPEFRVALLHGRMSSEEKELTMQRFKKGDIHILVSTSVIEVGVDIPNATIMLIEHAERFGLSQLHQLRGRVGRGRKKSYCILLTPGNIGPEAQQRIKIMEETTDGFVIAEEDLKLRGSGEFFGTRQHGIPDLKYTHLIRDQKLIQTARKDAFEIIEADPLLRADEHQNLNTHFQKELQDKFKLLGIS